MSNLNTSHVHHGHHGHHHSHHTLPAYTTGAPVYGGAPIYGGAYTTGVPTYSAGTPLYGGSYSVGAPVYGGAYTTGVPTYTGAPIYGGYAGTPVYTGAPLATSVVGGQTRDLTQLNTRLDDILARTKTSGAVVSPTRLGTAGTLRNSYIAPTASVLRTESPLRRSLVDTRARGVTYATSPLHTSYQHAVVSPLRTTTTAADLGYSQVARQVEPTFTYSKVVEPGVVTERQVVEPPVYTTTRHVEEGVETRTILEPSYETRTIVEPTYTTQRIVEQGVATQKVYEPYQVTSTRLVGENLVGGISTVGTSVRELETPGVGVSAVSGYNYRPYETVKSSGALVSPTRRYGSTAAVSSPLRTTNLAQSYVPTTGYATTGAYTTGGYTTGGYTGGYTTGLAQSYIPSTGYVSASPYVGGYATTLGAPYGGYATTVGAPYTTVGASPLVYGGGQYVSQTTGGFGGYADTGRTVRAGNVGRLENDVESLTTFDDDKTKKAAPAAAATKP